VAAAALANPDPNLIGAALGGDATAALAAAERAGIVVLGEERVRFAHPLLASTVYASAPAERRRQLHRLLGEVAAAPEERGRHLALGTRDPDESVAETLESAARDASLRGAPEIAAELAELACRLTPP